MIVHESVAIELIGAHLVLQPRRLGKYSVEWALRYIIYSAQIKPPVKKGKFEMLISCIRVILV